MTLQEYTKIFAGNSAHAPLTELYSFAQVYPLFSEGFDLITNTEYAWGLCGEDHRFAQHILPFAQADTQGSVYAFWLPAPTPLDQAPIVAFGREGGVHVVANHLAALLQLLSLDVEPLIDEDGIYYCKDEENYEPSPHIRAFKKWLRTHFKLSSISTNFEAEELVEAAQQTHHESFFDWIQPFLQPRPTLYN